MVSCVVCDWQGKEVGKVILDLKVVKEIIVVDLMYWVVLCQQVYVC